MWDTHSTGRVLGQIKYDWGEAMCQRGAAGFRAYRQIQNSLSQILPVIWTGIRPGWGRGCNWEDENGMLMKKPNEGSAIRERKPLAKSGLTSSEEILQPEVLAQLKCKCYINRWAESKHLKLKTDTDREERRINGRKVGQKRCHQLWSQVTDRDLNVAHPWWNWPWGRRRRSWNTTGLNLWIGKEKTGDSGRRKNKRRTCDATVPSRSPRGDF